MTRILSIAEMDEIVHQEGLRPSFLRMLGKETPAAGDSLVSRVDLRRDSKVIEDALDPGKIYEHFRSGKTLIQGGLNHIRPNLRTLARIMTEKFAAKSEVVAFLTPAGHRGAPVHSDPTDVYVIQLEGTKRWQVWPTPEVRRVGDDLKHDTLQLPEPVLDVSLRPGDVLYVPHNTPHMATAEESASLHLTIIAGPRMWSQLLSTMVQETLHNSPEFWSRPRLDDTSVDHAQIMREKVEELISRLRSMDLAQQLLQARDTGRAYRGVQQGRFFQDHAQIDAVDASTKLVAIPDVASFLDVKNGVATVRILGNTLTMPEVIASRLKTASHESPFRAGAFLVGEGEDRSVSVAKQLMRLGALQPSETE